MAGPARAHLPIGRGWPRLAEAGGCPELDLALTGCVKGRNGRRPRCGGLPRGGPPCPTWRHCRSGEWQQASIE